MVTLGSYYSMAQRVYILCLRCFYFIISMLDSSVPLYTMLRDVRYQSEEKACDLLLKKHFFFAEIFLSYLISSYSEVNPSGRKTEICIRRSFYFYFYFFFGFG